MAQITRDDTISPIANIAGIAEARDFADETSHDTAPYASRGWRDLKKHVRPNMRFMHITDERWVAETNHPISIMRLGPRCVKLDGGR